MLWVVFLLLCFCLDLRARDDRLPSIPASRGRLPAAPGPVPERLACWAADRKTVATTTTMLMVLVSHSIS